MMLHGLLLAATSLVCLAIFLPLYSPLRIEYLLSGFVKSQAIVAPFPLFLLVCALTTNACKPAVLQPSF